MFSDPGPVWDQGYSGVRAALQAVLVRTISQFSSSKLWHPGGCWGGGNSPEQKKVWEYVQDTLFTPVLPFTRLSVDANTVHKWPPPHHAIWGLTWWNPYLKEKNVTFQKSNILDNFQLLQKSNISEKNGNFQLGKKKHDFCQKAEKKIRL